MVLSSKHLGWDYLKNIFVKFFLIIIVAAYNLLSIDFDFYQLTNHFCNAKVLRPLGYR